MQFTIETSGIELTRDDRAHLEYRVFTALTPHGAGVRHVHIGLGHMPRAGRARRTACVITVLRHEGWLTARGAGDRVYTAVERAAERLAADVAWRAA